MPSRHLPTELLEDIFSQLSSSKSALYNLSLSCRTFYFLCKPFLYSHITIVTRVQRERLMQVRKEDAKLVKKLVIKGKERHARSSRMDGTECTVGSNIIEDLFSGKLLDISVLETLHTAHLYENAYHQQAPETLTLVPASNLIELSIYNHHGGGPSWEYFFADEENSPKLVCVGEYGISSYRPKIDLDPEGNSFVEFKAITEYRSLIPLALRSRLHAYACWPTPSTEWDPKNLSALTIDSSENLSLLADCVGWFVHTHWVPTSTLTTPSIDSCRELLVQLKSHDIKAPAFLSFPFSRSDFTPDILSVFSSIEDLGLELHFTVDEEEENSISLIPRSFVDFVRRQEKLKEEDKEKDNVIPSRTTQTPTQDVFLSIPPLPHQILIEIFSYLTTSPKTLCKVLLTCRTYHDLAKPALYFHIKIGSRTVRSRLREIRPDDAKLVRRLTIQTTGTGAGPGLLEHIFTGEILDISCIRTIHVANIAEADRQGLETDSMVIPIKNIKSASQLIELSINGHRGGGALWETLFRNHQHCLPKLSRLGIDGVTTYTYQMELEEDYIWDENSNREVLGYPQVEPFIHQDNKSLHDKLDVIVCNHRFGLGGKDGKSSGGVSTKHLVLSGPLTPLIAGWLRLAFKGGFNVKFLHEEGHEIPPNSNFQMLLEGAKQTKPPRARYLAWPYYKHELNKEVREIMKEFEKLKVKVYYREDQEGEERDSISIIPRQFVRFVAREKQEQLEGEESSSSSEEEGPSVLKKELKGFVRGNKGKPTASNR